MFWPLAASFPRFARSKKRVHSVISDVTTALASGVLLAVRVWDVSCGVWAVGCPVGGCQ